MSVSSEYTLPDIIGDNYQALASKRLDQLVLAGTHDSGAYKVMPAGTQLDGPWWKGPLYQLAASLGYPFASPWILTQRLTIQEQLMLGIRFFDLRISVGSKVEKPPDPAAGYASTATSCVEGTCCFSCIPGKWKASQRTPKDAGSCCVQSRLELPSVQHPTAAEPSASKYNSVSSTAPCFYISHGVPCVELLQVLQQLRSFLRLHTKEVVVLRMCADWDNRTALSPDLGEQLLMQVEYVLGDLLYNRNRCQPPLPGLDATMLLPTVAQMVTSQGPVALFVELPCRRDPYTCPRMYIGTGIDSYWAEDPTPEGTVRGLIRLIQADLPRAGMKPLRYAALAATPDVASISRGVAYTLLGLATGLRPLAAKTNGLLPQLLDQDMSNVLAITVDHPTEEVVRKIMGLNFAT